MKSFQIQDENFLQFRSSNRKYSKHKLKNKYVPPSTEIELFITNIWQDLLGYDNLGIEDNLLELGADSLIFMQVLPQIYQISQRIQKSGRI